MKNLIFYGLLGALILMSFTPTFAQQEWGDGEMQDVEIEIVKDRQITLPKANRLFQKIPPRPVEPIKPEITYSFKAFNFSTPELNPALRPLRLKAEEPVQSYRGYVSAGYGNYACDFEYIRKGSNRWKEFSSRNYGCICICSNV
jgi:hypothetical protein